MARTARRSTPSAMRKAVAKVVSGEATSSSLWLGTTISVSTSGRSSSRPCLHSQRQAEIGGFGGGGGWLGCPRQWLSATWPGLSPWECRTAQSRQGHPEDAQEPRPGPAKRGRFDHAALPR
eukprot:scaffold26575_cov50-Phaeocystis_antarctica.AAC.1